MEFKEHCDKVSKLLRSLHDLVDNLEEGMDVFEQNRTNDELATALVQGLTEANRLSETIRFEHILPLRNEDHAIAGALDIALGELVKRTWQLHHDLELFTKLQKPAAHGKPKTSSVKSKFTLLPV
jgi:hypothetical protein